MLVINSKRRLLIYSNNVNYLYTSLKTGGRKYDELNHADFTSLTIALAAIVKLLFVEFHCGT